MSSVSYKHVYTLSSTRITLTGKKAKKTGQSKMSRLPKSMRVDAEMLARFANLTDSEVERFRNSEAEGFVPEGFWLGTPTPIWKIEQARLRDAWRAGFTTRACVSLVSMVAKLSAQDQFFENIQRLEEPEAVKAIQENMEKHGTPYPPLDVYPYQEVIMMLFVDPWRARICEICGNHFIKEVQRDRYCSNACSKEAIRRRHNRWWREQGSLRRKQN